MDFSTGFFGKPINELLLADIQAFFQDAKEETDSIEFKSFAGQGSLDAKFEGIYKAVCAMLNSNGGIVIWGSPIGVQQAGRSEKTFQGALSPITQILEKDRTISKISSKITPMPEGVNVKIIEDGTNCVCVFEIQKSNYPPHQTGNVYYMRLDGQSVPAPHYFVEAMFRQVKFPNLEGYVQIQSITIARGIDPISYNLYVNVFLFNWSPLLNGKNVSFRLTTTKGVFHGHDNHNSTNRYWLNGQQIICDNVAPQLHHGAPLRKALIIIVPAAVILGDITLLLHFGDENSPMKASEYKLNFTMAQELGREVAWTEVSRSENIPMHELPGAMAMTKEEKLRQLLGRE